MLPADFADLAPLYFQLSRYLKESLRGCCFEDDEAVVMAKNERIKEQDQKFNFFVKAWTHCSKDEKNVLILDGIARKMFKWFWWELIFCVFLYYLLINPRINQLNEWMNEFICPEMQHSEHTTTQHTLDRDSKGGRNLH